MNKNTYYTPTDWTDSNAMLCFTEGLLADADYWLSQFTEGERKRMAEQMFDFAKYIQRYNADRRHDEE